MPEVPSSAVVETVYTTDKNGINTAAIVSGHRNDQPVSLDKIAVEEDPTAGASTTKKVHYRFGNSADKLSYLRSGGNYAD